MLDPTVNKIKKTIKSIAIGFIALLSIGLTIATVAAYQGPMGSMAMMARALT